MIQATVIADSISQETGDRLTSLEITCHRFILAEINTHCAFERNSASSRAIPLRTQLVRYIENPAYPASLPREQPGMSGGDELASGHFSDAEQLLGRLHASVGIEMSRYLADHQESPTRLHKSILSRYLEPFQWHTMILTGAVWQNFFLQRCSTSAQPEFRVLAEAIREALENSEPAVLHRGQWHTPYVRPDDYLQGCDTRQVSAARCARVSYLAQDGGRQPKDDVELFKRLVKQHHWSPLAHVATPDPRNSHVATIPDPDNYDTPIGNGTEATLRRTAAYGKWAGWQQYRHIIEARSGWDSSV